MSISRRTLRSLGILAATSGLALAGAGVASATTAEHTAEGTDVSVTFTLEDELADSCGAVLIPGEAALTAFEGLDLDLSDPTGAADALENLEGATLLTGDTGPLAVLTLVDPSATVSAEDVPSGIYGLVSFCASAPESPDVDMVMVGSPLDVISGLSSGGLLDSASALLQGGDEGGLGAILSSTLGEGDTEVG